MCYNKHMIFMRRFFSALKLLCSFVILFFATLFAASPVSALSAGDIVIEVTPADQEFSLAPGETYEGSFVVKNVGRLDLTFSLSASPYQVDAETYDPDFATETSQTLLKDWLSLPSESFTLAPDEAKTVKFAATAPADVPDGGQYAAILVQTSSPATDSNFAVTSQIAVTLRAHMSGKTRYEATLLEAKTPSFLLGSPISASATVQNSGNVDFRAAQMLTVHNFFTGATIFSDSTDASAIAHPVIMPGTTRTNAIVWSDAPALGLFRVVHTITILGQPYTSETIVFRCPIILAVLILAFVLLLILWLIFRIINRRRRKALMY